MKSSWQWAVVLLGVAAFPSGARAEGTLSVEPGVCMAADQLSSALSRVLSGGALPPDVMVTAREVPNGARFEVAEDGIVLGARTLELKDIPCEELIDAVALAIAIVVESRASKVVQVETAEPAEQPREPTVVSLPERELSDAEQRSVAVPIPPPSRSVRGALSLDGGVGVGVTPQIGGTTSLMLDVGVGSSVSAGVRPELTVRSGMFVAFPSEHELAETRVSSSVVAPRVDVCGGILGSSLRARACGTLIAGVLTAGVAGDYGRVAAGGRVDGRWMITPLFGMQAGVDMLANLAPNYVRLEGDLSELGPAALTFAGGPVVEFF